MKKVLLAAVALLACLSLSARGFRLNISKDIPEQAVQVLQERFGQMLEAAGHSLSESGAPLEVTAEVTDRMATPGSLSQVALTITLKAQCGAAEETFTLKGVGSDEKDAWIRAVKQLLPRSQTAQHFTDQL